MFKSLILFLLLPFFVRSQEQKLLAQDYSFLLSNGTVTKLHQSNDTLHELKCYIDRPCQPRPAKHFKILNSTKKGNFTILKLEQLDTIPLTTDPYPAERYFVWALKDITSKELGYLPLVFNITKEQIDTIQINMQSFEDKFFYSYFSDSYVKELSALKILTTKEEASLLLKSAKSEKYREMVERYAKTDTKDMYNAGFASHLLNRVCIDNGYNPIGAGELLNKLMK